MELGVFTRVSITYTREDPSVVTVELTEEGPLTARYEVRYSDKDGPAGDVDAELGNLLGRGLALGGRYRLGPDLEDERVSLQLPAIGRGDLVASVYRTSEDTPANALDPALGTNNSLERGFQVQQKVRLPRAVDLLFGYRFRRITLSSPLFLEPITVSVAALESTLLRDTRDFVLDARKGKFLSANLEYSPEIIGSDLHFLKSFSQAFFYHPVGSSFLWGQAYRLGLAWPFGEQDLIPDERFKAGGANSVRGYPTDSLGPVGILGDPVGGEATFVMNQELRYRHPSGLGGVLFWDAGNVFESVSALGLRLKHSLGLGLRWSSPIGPLRFDIARPLQPEPGAKRWGYYFSLGQVF
jgi:outer membrane protein assembly factor BamA